MLTKTEMKKARQRRTDRSTIRPDSQAAKQRRQQVHSLENTAGGDENKAVSLKALISHPQHNITEPLLLKEIFVPLNQGFCVLYLVCDGQWRIR